MNRLIFFLFALLPVSSLQQNAIDDSPGSNQSSFWPFFRQATTWSGGIPSNLHSLVLSATGRSFEEIMSRCYGRYGCFSTVGPWKNDLTRPVSLFPFSPEMIGPQYCLYTRRNPTECEPLLIEDPSSIYRSSYIPRGQVYFIAHGFVESGFRPWIKKMTEELLKRSSCNVIVIDWQKGAGPPYTQAVANIRLIGVMTAHLINTMVQEVVGLTPEKVHVIGHSLGAHLASYIGTGLRRAFGMRLGRITGLDPAEPHFAETDAIVRLDPSDAIFVDNIHTDAGGFTRFSLGMRAPIGHVDFYPNGGENQPGCPKSIQDHMARKNSSFTDGVRSYLNCHHIKSYLYFIETINNDLPTLGVECTSWEEYLNGSCFNCEPYTNGAPRCAPIGFHSIKPFLPKVNRRLPIFGDQMLTESPATRYHTMYLTTSESAPFFLNQYRVTIETTNDTREAGLLAINLIGSKGETGFISLDRMKYFDGGSAQTEVVAGIRIGKVVNALLKWSHQTSLFNFFSWRVHLPFLTVHQVTVEDLEQKERLYFCAPNKLQSGYPVTLKQCSPDNII